MEKATFGGGCFWCVEAAFERIAGVEDVTSGYAGGHVEDPTYEEVCTGDTGHAEVVQLTYDPDVVSYPELLEVFFKVHDPTTLNRQGNDVGTQYRSAVFTHSDDQQELAESFIETLEDEGKYDGIVTEVEPLDAFYEAAAYHQNYFEKNPDDAYCQATIPPKLEKLRENFEAQLKA
ncbi:peptide-methionine (S)-S-oxide reductase MsrA [Salarchaeum sp. JOR-1]|uniref:peptide-methionine (S)-S-oxide reductase MsrA n=1 Tax=Salarchaeum sp. JOR-1 TaxID=2599399 RepID=UPI001198A2C6|nr:peptide-methionine (S)-S-oxide reductase MsrA [Salarchaeum sp. JOR-1]QDX41116.1 peptide-methionine (S)-S-oxide reductase MsrA [Salarchaeum sp. JOR-1]